MLSLVLDMQTFYLPTRLVSIHVVIANSLSVVSVCVYMQC